MSRRAQQGAVARCPWCETSLPQLAAECPECRFPLTMAAADSGFRADHSGTTSTATPAGPSPSPLVPSVAAHTERPRAHGTRGHSLRVGAWLLGLLSVLLLLAGVGALVSTSSPEARSDREAMTSLLTALRRATVEPGYRQDVVISNVPAEEPADQPLRPSIAETDGVWFGASKSNSGSCFFLAGNLADGKLVGRGTLGASEPCTGAEVHRRFAESEARKKP